MPIRSLIVRDNTLQYKDSILNWSSPEPLRCGVSLFWSQWDKFFWNWESLLDLKEKWKASFVRLPLGHDKALNEGYMVDFQGTLDKAFSTIDSALKVGLYVIVDCHDHYAVQNSHMSTKLLYEIAKKYKNHPGILYEIVNEPLDCTWKEIKEHCEFAIQLIHSKAPDAVCIVGTPEWCSNLSGPMDDPLDIPNIMYSYHFYSATHKDKARMDLEIALEMDLPVFVTECGASEHTGNGTLDFEEFDKWLNLLESKYRVPWCIWSLSNKGESSSLIREGKRGVGDPQDWTDYGLFAQSRISTSVYSLSIWSPFRKGIPYPFKNREEREKKTQELLKRVVPVPVTLLKVMVQSILANPREEEIYLFYMWLSDNWGSINREAREGLVQAFRTRMREVLEDTHMDNSKARWAMHRLADTFTLWEKGNFVGG